eukprot:g2203.t1
MRSCRLGLALSLVAAALLYPRLPPPALGALDAAAGAVLVTAGALGKLLAALAVVLVVCTALELLGMIAAEAAILNAAVILPLNVVVVGAYYLLFPLRFLYCRWLNMEATHLISLFIMRPTLKDASFKKVIEAVQIGYRAVFAGRDILEQDPLMVKRYLEQNIFGLWPLGPGGPVRRLVARWLPPAVLRLAPVRVVISFALIPLLGWWLLGLSWVGFVPLHAPRERPCGGSGGEADEEVGGGGTLLAEAAEPPAPQQVVVMQIPDCRFLREARKHFESEAVGNAACVNE